MYTTHDFINIKLASSTLIICNENKDAANSTSKKDKIYFVNVEYSEWIPAVYKCNRQKKKLSIPTDTSTINMPC